MFVLVPTRDGGFVILPAGLQGWEERLKISDRAHIGEFFFLALLVFELGV